MDDVRLCGGEGQTWDLGFGLWFCSVCGYTGPNCTEPPIIPGFDIEKHTAELLAADIAEDPSPVPPISSAIPEPTFSKRKPFKRARRIMPRTPCENDYWVSSRFDVPLHHFSIPDARPYLPRLSSIFLTEADILTSLMDSRSYIF